MFSLLVSRRIPRDIAGTIRTALFSTRPADRHSHSVERADMPFLHHGDRPRFRGKPKFKSPRKRASGLYQEIVQQAMEQTRQNNPQVHGVKFRVGDAIEIQQVAQGGINSTELEKIRGVVIGIFNKKLDTTVLIRDVLFGFPVERRVPLYSPLIKSLKVLEENFVFKGKRKVKRAKLYYLRDRNPLGTFVETGAQSYR